MAITYVLGDATEVEGPRPNVIAYVCNDFGDWGKGFVVAINRRWAEPEAAYRKWARGGEEFGQDWFSWSMLARTWPLPTGSPSMDT